MAQYSTPGTFPGGQATFWTRPGADVRGAALGGIVAGLIGGIVMAMVAMIVAGAMGMGFWLPAKLIAATFYGVDALIGDAGVIMVGLLIHMMMSAGFGLVFGLIGGGRLSAGAAFGAGLVWGILVWAAMTFLGLPLVNHVMSERMALQPILWFVYHLIFGGMLFLTPLLAHAFSGSRRAPA